MMWLVLSLGGHFNSLYTSEESARAAAKGTQIVVYAEVK
jgi:hypothetical protein